jgi:hypothetical protein
MVIRTVTDTLTTTVTPHDHHEHRAHHEHHDPRADAHPLGDGHTRTHATDHRG